MSDACFCQETGHHGDFTQNVRSQQAYITALASGEPLIADQMVIHPLCWSSTRIRRVCRSTWMAEAIALSFGVEHGLRLRAARVDTNHTVHQFDMQQKHFFANLHFSVVAVCTKGGPPPVPSRTRLQASCALWADVVRPPKTRRQLLTHPPCLKGIFFQIVWLGTQGAALTRCLQPFAGVCNHFLEDFARHCVCQRGLRVRLCRNPSPFAGASQETTCF